MNPINLKRAPLRSLIIILAGTIAALACGWSLLNEHSVRFSERTGRAFYRLPPLPLRYDKATGKEIAARDIENSDYETAEDYDERLKQDEQTVAEVDKTWDRAMQSIDETKLDETAALLGRFLEMTDLPLPERYDDEEKRQKQRNTATDMLDALSATSHGSKSGTIQAYLRARRTFDEAPSSAIAAELKSQAPIDNNLRDNWEYLEAAAAYKSRDLEGAGLGFHMLIVHYPNSEKVEAAFYMKAKIAMEASSSYGNTECGFYGKDLDAWDPTEEVPESKSHDSSRAEIDEKCRDSHWGLALNTFQGLMRSYPNGRYFDDARGWVAYLYRRGGQRAEALAEYYRMLGHPTSLKLRLEAKQSLQMLGHHYDDETLDRVEELLANDVDGAMAYAYHRIYNHAIDFSYQEPWVTSGDWSERQKERDRIDKLHGVGTHELERVAKFATKMMARFPRAAISGAFVLRVAEAQLELQNFDEATKLATKSLSFGIQGDLRAQAFWVKGSGEHRQRRFEAADATFKQLLKEFPKSKYVEGSRRLRAMIAEDRGDLESALEMYFELDYKTDVAYFLDVLIPTDRLAKFAESHKSHAQYNNMLYALGVRYMREKRWDDARAMLRRVQTERGVDEYLESEPNATWRFSKEPTNEDEKLKLIKTSWVLQDLKTIDALEHYERAIASAEGDAAKTEAMYQLASAYYEADDLAFYNPAAWGGGRVGSLSGLEFTDHERQQNESQIIFDYMKGHDPWAHSIPIYEEIVAKYPNTKVAKDALYSAAVAHERLSNRNSAWTGFYERGLFPGPRLISYNDVKSIYPDYQLPRGTYGWKPSSRTVNGGPGWAPPPKPIPRETKEQKIKRLLRETVTTISDYSNKILPKVENKVDAGIDWSNSMIEAAVYGTASGIGLWVIILVGVGLHKRRHLPESITQLSEPRAADSRVDKFLE